MKHIVNFSGGVCSFWAAHRVIQQHGTKDVTLLFADTLEEDWDLYRFLDDAALALGVPVTRVSKGISVWDLFDKRRMISNSKKPVCSHVLKRDVLDAWRKKHCLEYDTTIYIGLDWTETHRVAPTRFALKEWRVEFPMMDEPLWDKCRMLEELRRLGIKVPRLYELGFPHNNCGGCCVKAGHAHFAHLLRTLRGRYAQWEGRERVWRERVGKNFTVLTDRSGDGIKKPLTLEQFRKNVEAGKDYDRDDWGGCGCAVEDPSSTQNAEVGHALTT